MMFYSVCSYTLGKIELPVTKCQSTKRTYGINAKQKMLNGLTICGCKGINSTHQVRKGVLVYIETLTQRNKGPQSDLLC